MNKSQITKLLRQAKTNKVIQTYTITDDCDVYIAINDSKFCIGSTVEDAMIYTMMKQYNIVK